MDERKIRIRIWDGAVRLFHWGTVLLIPLLWGSWKLGWMEVHGYLGLALLALLLFRLSWGLIGSDTARFSHFVKGPRAIGAYLRAARCKEEFTVVGHNPLGALSVLVLLAVLTFQVMSGLFAQDIDGIFSGPLSSHIDYDTADAFREWHGTIFNFLLIFIGLHVGAILFHWLAKHDDLLTPMLRGWNMLPSDTRQPWFGPIRLALCLFILALLTTVWVGTGAPLP